MDFGKIANSIMLISMDDEISVLLLEICLATIGVCVFRCGNFGCRTFYLHRKIFYFKEKEMKNFKVVLFVCLLILTCSLIACDKSNSDTSVHEHSYGEWKTTLEATCTQTGTQERSCDCGEKDVQSLPMIDHKPVETKGKVPTALSNGLSSGSACEICGKVFEEQKALLCIKDYIKQNYTDYSDGVYTWQYDASKLDPSLSGIFFLYYYTSDHYVLVSYYEYTGQTKDASHMTAFALKDDYSTSLAYYHKFRVAVGGTIYSDFMTGRFLTTDFYNINKLEYNNTTTTIGGSESYQAERFAGYQTKAYSFAKNAVKLLDTVLEKAGFGYGVEVFGFYIP